jgi:SAM-dependent methyltransferase
MFRRCKIEDLEVPGRFDAAVASLALHHVDELGRVLEKIHSLLKARGRFIVKEFAWDHMDRRTAAWIVLRRGALPRRIRRHYRTSSDRAFLTSWKRNLGDLHQYRTLRRALERRFQPVLFAWTPYLYEWPGGFTTKREERRLIEAGLINATGFRFVGRRR